MVIRNCSGIAAGLKRLTAAQVTIRSISTDENQFFRGEDGVFEPIDLPPHSNVTVPFLFVPQTLGIVHSSIFIGTSIGDFTYRFQARTHARFFARSLARFVAIHSGVRSCPARCTKGTRLQAVGMANAHGIEPVEVVIEAGAPYEKSFPIHNPSEKATRVLEVYTPEDAFQLQLPEPAAGAKAEDRHQAKLWQIQPKERKTAIQLTFVSKTPTHVAGYIHIRTDTDTFVIGVDVTVADSRVVAVPNHLPFGLLTGLVGPVHSVRTLQLLNTHDVAIECDSVDHTEIISGASLRQSTAVEITHRILGGGGSITLAAGEQKEALEVRLSAVLASDFEEQGQYEGRLLVMCRPARDAKRRTEPDESGSYSVEVVYSATILAGALQYRQGTVELVMGADQAVAESSVEVSSDYSNPLLVLSAFTLDPSFR
jgi:hypothetical protein